MNTDYKEVLKNQWVKMLESGRIPIIEFLLKNGDYLTVNIEINNKGFLFSFDDSIFECKKFYFNGEILQINKSNFGLYILPFDEYFDNIDFYLENIYNNILEGCLLPYNLIDL